MCPLVLQSLLPLAFLLLSMFAYNQALPLPVLRALSLHQETVIQKAGPPRDYLPSPPPEHQLGAECQD